MELTDIIILNDKEYTVTLNRESAVHIERYGKIQENMQKVAKPVIEYVDRDILKGENPFATPIDEDKLLEEANQKEELLTVVISKAFWIWLYPKHQIDYEDVYSIIKDYMQDDEKAEFIGGKYAEYLDKSTNIRQKYLDEQKKVKAQAMKKN